MHLAWSSVFVVCSGVVMLDDCDAVREATDEPPGTTACEETLHPFCQTGLWGYVDNNGDVVVAPQFRVANDFFEGLATVRRDESHGVIRTDGSFAFVLPRGHAPVSRFAEGRCWFYDGHHHGFIDQEGTVVVRPIYDWATDYSEGLAAVMQSTERGESRQRDGTIREQWGYVDRHGAIAISMSFASASRFGNGLARIVREDATHFEYIDSSGAVAFSVDERFVADPKNYVRHAGDFADRRSFVLIDGRGADVPSAVMIDVLGRVVGHTVYESLGAFSEGIAAFGHGGKRGYINTEGEIVADARFDDGGMFSCGLCPVQLEGEWMYIDSEGAVAVRAHDAENTWNDAEEFHGGLARVHIGGRFLRTDGGPQYWDGGAWWYVNSQGVIVGLCRRDGDKGGMFGREIP